MKLCVIGTGYVGLVAGTCFAESGNDVICVDIDHKKITSLQSGKAPIYEPGLEELIRRNTENGRLRFTSDLVTAVKDSLVCFIAVGTPSDIDGSADVRTVLQATTEVARAMPGYRIVVLKSTVPVGTADRVRESMSAYTSHPFDIVSNPEFLKEGAAVEDFMKPDRVVIGGSSERALSLMKELYAPFVRTENPILVMDNRSAEMTKYAANAFLATRISFINEVANLCDKVGADVAEVRRGIGFDRRIGHYFLFPGVGYGGSCFPKDVRALIRTAEEHGAEFSLLRSVEEINERQKHLLVEKVRACFGADLHDRKFAVWGLAFKPRTDDMREAPAIVIIEELLAAGAEIAAHDPEAMTQAQKLFGDRISYHRVNYDTLTGADALLIVTEWNEFRRPDFKRMRTLMKTPIIFDGRNLYEPTEMRQEGFTYYPIGRPAVVQP
ncbi:MAG TPA: UDP-glucose/GDP-mannose dehydrogenase family protein [Methylomirabilota bacterium]|jgi:UDPglucose 6-dehydrogenase|nr:UDP-glucose/GDP-mannose dehydrogenase family protein [Methylomirabilota bacterium]